MPYTLTEQEKEQLRQEYLENLRILNSYLPNEHKYKVDLAGLNKRLNDPNEVRFYKKGLELKAALKKKSEIYDALDAKYSHLKIPGKVYPLTRYMHSEMIPSDDPEAMRLNEERMKQYFLHPEAEVQRRMQRVLNADIKDVAKIANCKDKDNLLLEYYEKNSTLVEDAFNVKSILDDMKKNKEIELTPDCAKYYEAIAKDYEVLIDASDSVQKMGTSYFTMPKHMTTAQDNIFNSINCNIETEQPEVYKKFHDSVVQEQNKQLTADDNITSFVNNCKKKDIDFTNNDTLTNVVGMHEGKVIPLKRWFFEKMDNNQVKPTVKRLTNDEVNNVKKIFTKDFTKEKGYKEPYVPLKFQKPVWQQVREDLMYKYAARENISLAEAEKQDLSKVASSIGGGVGERLFNTTSREYKNVITTLKDYDNPKHVHYHDGRALSFSANQYLIHKGVKTVEEAMALPQPGRDRALLCLNIMDVAQKDADPKLGKFVPGTNEVIKDSEKKNDWPPVFDDNSLFDDSIDNKSMDDADLAHNNNIIKDNEIEKDVEK